VDAFRDIDEIDLLLVDGPPGSLGEMARYPALHVLESQLASNAVVILDDADRPDERHRSTMDHRSSRAPQRARDLQCPDRFDLLPAMIREFAQVAAALDDDKSY
jgi:hypothetical protein